MSTQDTTQQGVAVGNMDTLAAVKQCVDESKLCAHSSANFLYLCFNPIEAQFYTVRLSAVTSNC